MTSQAPPARSETPAGSYVEDELVVALPYERLLAQTLDAWGAAPRVDDGDRDPRLGLARVRLSAASALARLEREHADRVADARAGAGSDGYEPSPLDLVGRCLRSLFKDEFAGWTPEFGKNRIVSRLTGSYVIGGGGVGKATAHPDYVIGGGGSGRPTAKPDYVIGGGGTGRPTAHSDYVIGGGGTGRGGRLARPEYVIGGGGTGTAEAGSVSVPLRAAHPGAGVRVAVVDTSAARHPWLDGAVVTPAHELFRPDGGHDPEMVAHGTFVVGMVLRQAPGATVIVREGLDEEASQDSWSLARVVADLALERPAVVNLSLGCLTDDDQAPLVLSAAVDALGPDTVVVAAAGNHGKTGVVARPSWPAALDSVLAVGAVDAEGAPAAFSPQVPWVDAVSEGVDVVSTLVQDDPGDPPFGSWSGTSFAAGAVTGAIAAHMSGSGRDARAAWASLAQAADRDAAGRPIVPLTPFGDAAS